LGGAHWIWLALHDLAPTKYAEVLITERLSAAGRSEPETDWLALKQCEGNWRDPETLNIGLLARRLMGGSIPMALTVQDESPLTVSTVHRAKGLEYGHVLFIESGVQRDEDKNYDEMTRHTYVAMSRARDSILSAVPAPAGTFQKASEDWPMDGIAFQTESPCAAWKFFSVSEPPLALRQGMPVNATYWPKLNSTQQSPRG
jgi:hypothetical protein